MFNEEIEMTLECAVKVRKHLVRILETRNDEGLRAKLQYINGIIMQANSLQDQHASVVFA